MKLGNCRLGSPLFPGDSDLPLCDEKPAVMSTGAWSCLVYVSVLCV